MTAPWLHIVGIGEDGLAGLAPAARAVVESAELIVGGDRHDGLAAQLGVPRRDWPDEFDDLVDMLRGLRGRRVAVLVAGDPLWFSVGARLGRRLPVEEIVYHPQISAFQLAAARMRWSLADMETLTAHGRPAEQIIAHIQPGARLLILSTGEETPGKIARFLAERGYGRSRMTLFASMGGPAEARFDGLAECWDHDAPAFTTLAVECVAAPDAALLPRGVALPDEAYLDDGALLPREVRAATLAKLMPMRGALLWDVGAGCGAVAIEWMRAAVDALAVAVEPDPARRTLAADNALALGAPRLEVVAGDGPGALAGRPAPDAAYLAPGLTEAAAEACLAALRPLGRLVANAATAQEAALLERLHARHGGELARIAVGRREAEVWRDFPSVIQWSLVRR